MPCFTAAQTKAFASMWKKWWCALQPDWRDISSWPLSRALDVSEDWAVLSVGGPNGIFLPLMALSWWLGATDGKEEDSLCAVDDMAHVLERMTAAYIRVGPVTLGKRKGSAGNSRSGKRRAT